MFGNSFKSVKEEVIVPNTIIECHKDFFLCSGKSQKPHSIF